MPLTCKLVQVLEKKEVSQRKLAQAVGITPNEVWLYATGNREPRIGVALKIARHLGLPVEGLWQYDVPKQRRRQL